MSTYSKKKQLLSLLLTAVTILSCSGCSKDSENYYNPRAIVQTLDDENPDMQDSRTLIKNEVLTCFNLFSDSNYEKSNVDEAFKNIKTDFNFNEAYNFLNHYLDYLKANDISDPYCCATVEKHEKSDTLNILYTDNDNKKYGLYIDDKSTFSERDEMVIEDVMTDNLMMNKRYDFTADIPAGDKHQDDPYGKWEVSYALTFRDKPFSVYLYNENYMKKIGSNFINQGSEYSIILYYDGEELYKETLDKNTFFKYLESTQEIYDNDLNFENLQNYDNKILKILKIFGKEKIRTK